MTPDKSDAMLNEILADERMAELRLFSLSDALGEMRQARRRRRQCYAVIVGLPLVLSAALLVFKAGQNKTESNKAVVSAPRPVARVSPKEADTHTLSDEELFALFPGRRMALIGKPGRQELVFLDARDPR